MIALKSLFPCLQLLLLFFFCTTQLLSHHFGTVHPLSSLLRWRPILFSYLFPRADRGNAQIVLTLCVRTAITNEAFFFFLTYLDVLDLFLLLDVFEDGTPAEKARQGVDSPKVMG